jgi:hypothetical protein
MDQNKILVRTRKDIHVSQKYCWSNMAFDMSHVHMS